MMQFLPPKLLVLERTYDPDPVLVAELISVLWDKPVQEELIATCWPGGPTEAYKVPSGLVLIQSVEWESKHELLIYGMVGSGILFKAEEIISDLKAMALYRGCDCLGGIGVPEGWLKVAPRLGFQPVSTHYVMELNDGR